MVFLVSRTLHEVPSIASTHVRVSVAIPLRCPKKLSAVRSASNMARVSPRTVSNTLPALTLSPSRTNTAISLSPTSSKTPCAISIPAMTPFLRATKSATIFELPATVATEVISSPPAKSSAMARLISSRSIMAGPLPDNQLSIFQLD